MNQMIFLLLAEIQGLDQIFQLLDPRQKFLDPFFQRSDLHILVDNRVLKIVDLPVGVRVLGVQILNSLD